MKACVLHATTVYLLLLAACVSCSDDPGQDRCTGITPGSCCNVYVVGRCDSDCPDDGVYTIDLTTFECRTIIHEKYREHVPPSFSLLL